ncbi:MAG: hypothetical protein ABIZ80_21385 [Bryobacteraceae bacterium]
MRSIFTSLLLLLLAVPCVAAEKKEKKTTPTKIQTLTGCVDETPSGYVLRGDNQLKQIAALEPVGFAKENLARHVGHKVTVSGKLTGPAEAPVFRVQSVKELADYCAPDGESPPK